MHRAPEIFQATEGDVHTQCVSALTWRCFEELAVTEAQAVTDGSKSPAAARILQQELSSLLSLAPCTWNAELVLPKPTGNTGVCSQTSCEPTGEEILAHLALKFCVQILTIPFLKPAWHSQEEMLKLWRFALVMETIPSLKCVSVRALPAAEHQELKANTARGFRVEKADKIDVQNSNWNYL